MGFLAAYTPYMKDVQNKKQGTHPVYNGPNDQAIIAGNTDSIDTQDFVLRIFMRFLVFNKKISGFYSV